MYHRLFFLLVFLTIFGCSPTRHSTPYALQISNLKDASILFQKVNFRIESNGQLRTHRSSLSFYSDTLIHLAIFSGFNRKIAIVDIDSKGMQFYDLFSKEGFFISSKEFSDEFGIFSLPQTIKALLLGYYPDTVYNGKILKEFENIKKDTSVLSLTFKDNSNIIHINSLVSQNSILINHLFNSKYYESVPHSIYITLAINDSIYEFDLEINIKSSTGLLPVIEDESVLHMLSNFTFKND